MSDSDIDGGPEPVAPAVRRRAYRVSLVGRARIFLIISSAIFSLLHSLNPNVNYIALTELFIAGILLGVSYVYTKNLWFPIALHLSWNFFQVMFGFNVSGMDTYSLIEFEILENNNINGGDFGFEGSYLSILFSLIMIYFLWRYYKKFTE